MARRRGQAGQLLRRGPSWLFRWREDARDADGNLQTVFRDHILWSELLLNNGWMAKNGRKHEPKK